MSPPVTLVGLRNRSTTHTRERLRLSSVAAYLAAPLWALQAVIWLGGPKVQEAVPPYTITKPLHFALFWFSIAGAVAFSAAAAGEIPRATQRLGSRPSWWARLLARIALCSATAATIATVAALIPAVQGVALTLMTGLLNGALVVLALHLGLCAFLSWRGRTASRLTRMPVTAAAAATVAMIVATLASGSDSVVGLYVAVAVALLNGAAWFIWGKAAANGRLRVHTLSKARS